MESLADYFRRTMPEKKKELEPVPGFPFDPELAKQGCWLHYHYEDTPHGRNQVLDHFARRKQ